MIIDVVIPAFNEEDAIGKVLGDLPKNIVRNIIVVDNNSTDNTRLNAEREGAVVLHQSIQGYGASCLKGMEFLSQQEVKPGIVVFLDGDYSDYPRELPLLTAPIESGHMDMVIGSRVLGERERFSLTPQQIIGNWVAVKMLKILYGYSFTDLGPFRAIRYDELLRLGMNDKNYGWTVEMQIKAAKMRLRCTEVPVSYKMRIGKSKVSGTLKGSLMAGYKIITTLLRYV
ncbi:glycosyltransferase family 2 protein [Salibacteraceae bacterium]|nr:glycosyltransferase family 2 protein [Salibacteraceae bacterium]MDA9267132.1 glycosyltransferase family 2 protein [Salibacteraceae bacterium]